MNTGKPDNTCTTPDCESPSGDLYLCAQCIRDFQAWIDQVPLLLPELDVTIARLDNVRVGNIEGGNGTKSAGSAAPLNIDAVQLKINLKTVDRQAKDYAKEPHAAQMAALLTEWITKAELLISGPEEEHINHEANRAKVEEIAPPMPTRQLLPWLRKNAKISITSQHIRDWVRRGHLKPVEREPSPTYHPHEVIAAHHRKDTP